ncbi:probable deoxycytidylate deaminase isoform X2 [Teleopsis dalmanni]|nr:probable deoxycytidylate deaminase isoform X2 [Teleopsis dalmanni]XP_037936644.1 probable deoxycytidylate deaminase isoform X2 [Teleopsis dalmanni]
MSTSYSMGSKRENYIEWDDYFMALALLSSKRSKDPVTQVGACIVDNEKRIVAIGYNGLPRNCHDDDFPWCKPSDLNSADPLNNKKLYVVHAEANAILNRNCASLEGMKLYSTLFPCNECSKLIIQSGIKYVYYISDKYSQKSSYLAAKRMFDAVGITYTRMKPKQNRIVIDFADILEEDQQESINIESLKI